MSTELLRSVDSTITLLAENENLAFTSTIRALYGYFLGWVFAVAAEDQDLSGEKCFDVSIVNGNQTVHSCSGRTRNSTQKVNIYRRMSTMTFPSFISLFHLCRAPHKNTVRYFEVSSRKERRR